MTYTVLALYPADAKFDLEYYTSHHMPLVVKEWTKFGFQGYTVCSQLSLPITGASAPYSVFGILSFSSAEAFKDSVNDQNGSVMGDLKNFSNKPPTMVGGEDVAK